MTIPTELGRPDDDPTDDVGAKEQAWAENQTVEDYPAIVGSHERPHHVRDRKADEGDRAGNHCRTASQGDYHRC